jgi:NADH:ubiquinone oxidoreductase subunit C
LQFNLFSDLCVIDWLNLGIKNRFQIIYNFLSIRYFLRLFCSFAFTVFKLPSLYSVFNSASWLEREVWDLFGIFFFKHKDLRRILTDYGFEGFPLRKDFPLTGYIELRYSEEALGIVYEPVELTQEFRVFTFSNTWEI